MKNVNLDKKLKDIIIKLRKIGRDKSQSVLVAISNALDTSRRRRAKVNVFKLDILSKRHKDKVFVVPGNVLGYGSVEGSITVYAYSFSKNAILKIKEQKGTPKTLDSLVKDNVEPKNIMIVK